MSSEDLVHWEGMSQSLQDRFLDIEDRIQINKSKIEHNKKVIQKNQLLIDQMSDKIDELRTRITNKFNKLHNKIADIVIDGKPGELSKMFIEQSELGGVARVDTKTRQLYGSRMVEFGLVYTTMDEKEAILAADMGLLYSEYGIEQAMYDLANDVRMIYSRDGNSWTSVGTIDEWLPKYCFILNPVTHKLYFYECQAKWTDLSALCDSNSGTIYRF